MDEEIQQRQSECTRGNMQQDPGVVTANQLQIPPSPTECQQHQWDSSHSGIEDLQITWMYMTLK